MTVCDHHAPNSCMWCADPKEDRRHVVRPAPGEEIRPRTGGAAALVEAAFSDESVRRRRAWSRAAAAQRLEEVRTSAAAREAWLESFPQEWREEMARRVTEAYGPAGVAS